MILNSFIIIIRYMIRSYLVIVCAVASQSAGSAFSHCQSSWKVQIASKIFSNPIILGSVFTKLPPIIKIVNKQSLLGVSVRVWFWRVQLHISPSCKTHCLRALTPSILKISPTSLEALSSFLWISTTSINQVLTFLPFSWFMLYWGNISHSELSHSCLL